MTFARPHGESSPRPLNLTVAVEPTACQAADFHEAGHALLRLGRCERQVEQMRLFDQAGLGRLIGGVDRRLGERDRTGRERGDAARQALDERAQLGRRQGAIEVSPALGQIGGHIVAAEHHLEGAGTADQARQALRTAAARNDAEGDLGLREDGAAERTEAHVEREQELAAAPAGAALDHADRRRGHGAEAIDHAVEGPQRGRFRRRLLRHELNQRHVGVGDEEVRVGAAEHHDAHRIVALELTADAVEILDHRQVEQVDRRMIDRHPCHAIVHRHRHGCIAVVRHRALPALHAP
jgi:hypothetical protein